MKGLISKVTAERGVALIVALLVMFTLSILAIIMMTSMHSETKISGLNARSSKALYIAEAGVAEAASRIGARDVPDSLKAQMVTQIFLAVPGSVPALGADSTALATSQPAGSWLRYSTPGRDSAALTVTYKTDAARTKIYRYDPSSSPAVQFNTGQPIFKITSTGRAGNAVRTITTEVVRKGLEPALLAAVSVHSATTKLWCGAADHGPFIYNGMNHRSDTPTGAGAYAPDPENYVGSGDLPAFWATSAITWGGNRYVVCCPPIGAVLELQPKPSFYTGPWDALNITQAEFYALVGAHKTTVPASLKGITYLDNNSTLQDATGKWTLSGASGEGLLYVDGDLVLNGDFTWRGLVYVEGNLDINGNVWMLGGLVVADPNQFACQHIRATFLYSKDAIANIITGNSKEMHTLTWHETR